MKTFKKYTESAADTAGPKAGQRVAFHSRGVYPTHHRGKILHVGDKEFHVNWENKKIDKQNENPKRNTNDLGHSIHPHSDYGMFVKPV